MISLMRGKSWLEHSIFFPYLNFSHTEKLIADGEMTTFSLLLFSSYEKPTVFLFELKNFY